MCHRVEVTVRRSEYDVDSEHRPVSALASAKRRLDWDRLPCDDVGDLIGCSRVLNCKEPKLDEESRVGNNPYIWPELPRNRKQSLEEAHSAHDVDKRVLGAS